MSNIVLRDYQEKAVSKAVWATQLDGNDLLVLATGAGKSIVIAEIANRLHKNILILQPNKEILEQNYSKMLNYVSDFDIGIFSASMNERTIRKFTFATIGSIYKKPSYFAHIGMVIIDEAHQVNMKNGSSMFNSFINGVNKIRRSEGLGDLKIIGLTATPYRNMTGYHTDPITKELYSTTTLKLINRVKPEFWKRILVNVGIGDLVEQGYLCPLKYEHREFLKHDEIPLNKTQSGFELEAYGVKLGSKQQQVVDCVLDAEKRFKQVLVFCPSVSVATKFASCVPGSEVVSAKTKADERDRIIRGFKKGLIKTVFNMGVLCLDQETEILTRRGFVGKDEFDLDTDEVANFEEGRIWFSPALGYVQRDREIGEEMVSLETRNRSVRVTSNHRMLWKKSSKSPEWYIIPAAEVVDKMGFVPVSGRANPEIMQMPDVPLRYMVTQSYKTGQDLSIPECLLIGFWLGDGSKFYPNSGGMKHTISQSKVYPHIVKFIDETLVGCGRDFSKYDKGDHYEWQLPRGTGGKSQARKGFFDLEPFLDKAGSDFLWSLTEAQFDAVMLGFWYADGDHGKGGYRPKFRLRISNTNFAMLSTLQSIAVCRGYRASIKKNKSYDNGIWKDLYRLSITKRPTHCLTKFRFQKERIWQQERVWCVTTESGNLITRRNGTVTIMGNTTGFDHPALDCIVLLRPTRSLALLMQMCLDMETEILTRRGFVKHAEFDIKTDEVAAMDQSDGSIKWTFCSDVTYRDIHSDEYFVSAKGPQVDFRVTNQHDLLAKARRSKKYLKRTAESLIRRNDMFCLPISGIEKRSGCFLSEAELQFLGLFLSDGTVHKTTISITQSLVYPEIVDRIRQILTDCRFKFGEYVRKRKGQQAMYADAVVFTISKGSPRGTGKHLRGWQELERFINKDLSNAYEELSADQVKSLLQGILWGDGDKKAVDYDRKTTRIALGVNPVYANRLQSLLVRSGFKCHLTTQQQDGNQLQYLAYVSKKEYVTIAGNNVPDNNIGNKPTKRTRLVSETEVTAPEKVWCVTNPYGTIITRRNGKVLIMGNCGRGVRIAEGKEHCTLIDWTGTIKQVGEIETVQLRREQLPEFQSPMWEIFSQTELGEKRWHNTPLYRFKVKEGSKSGHAYNNQKRWGNY